MVDVAPMLLQSIFADSIANNAVGLLVDLSAAASVGNVLADSSSWVSQAAACSAEPMCTGPLGESCDSSCAFSKCSRWILLRGLR